jgi:single-stranded-DNA-specific exonuclease
MNGRWTTRELKRDIVDSIAVELGVHPISAEILASRGIFTPDEARAFLSPNLSELPDPDPLIDMDAATARIEKALREEQKIAVFGDYDVDGISGAALLVQFFRDLDAAVEVYLPSRVDGYGLLPKHVDLMHSNGASLIVTVDNGTRSFEAAGRARDLGLDLIITDHHEHGEDLPDAFCTISPHRLPAGNPFCELSGCAVAFMLLISLRRRLRKTGLIADGEPNLKQHLDLVALGTIADVMELTGTNRILVRHGMAQIAVSSKPGIRSLMRVSQTEGDSLTTGAVAFRLAPRINAVGRIGDPQVALRLLTSRDEAEALEAARLLDKANRERQDIEERMLQKIDAMLSSVDKEKAHGLVFASGDFHPGVIGIAAQKVSQLTGLPTAIISRDTSPPRGSARSVGGLNIIDVLQRCGEFLNKFGGHPMAAGMTIEDGNIEGFRSAFDSACKELATAEADGDLEIDAEAKISDITERLVEEIGLMEPFGQGNPEPILAIRDVRIVDKRIVGSNHLRLTIADHGASIDAIGFKMADALDGFSCSTVSIAGTPCMNRWNGVDSIQLKIKDIVPCSR